MCRRSSLTQPLKWGVALLLFLAIASFLRLYDLGEKSLWHDELFSADISLNRALTPQPGAPFFQRIELPSLGTRESFWTIKAADQSPPLYELLNKASIFLFGDSESGIRALSVAASLAFLAWLGLRAYRHQGMRLGVFYLAAMAVYTTSGFMVFYAQEARAYSLGAAFSGAIAILFFERALYGWQEMALPRWPELCLLMAAATTHYNLTALVALVLGFYALEAWRRKEGRALLRMSAVPALVLTWLSISYHSFLRTAEGQFGWMKIGYGEALWVGLKGITLEALGWPHTIVIAATLLAAACFRPSSLNQTTGPRRNWRSATWILATLAIIYFLAMTAVMQQSRILHLRHYIFPLTLFYLLFAIAISEIWEKSHQLGWIFLVIALAAQWPFIRHFHSVQKPDFRNAIAAAVEQLDDQDLVFTDFMLNPAGYDYYLKRKTSKKLSRRPYYSSENVGQVCAAIHGRIRFALIRASQRNDLSEALKNSCGQAYEVQKIDSYMITTEVWTKRP